MKSIELIFMTLGAILGAYIRYRITSFPIIFGIVGSNVLVVNVVGSFIVGVFSVISTFFNLNSKYSFLIAIGFCGSLTTMSSFVLESIEMMENKQLLYMMINVLSNVFFSIVALYVGRILITQILK
jgi:CrcB protein